MSLNLPLPPLDHLLPTATLRATPTATGFVVFHPRYASWLKRSGFQQSQDFLNLAGEIVSGHADRHVRRVMLPTKSGPRVLFLKIEHVVSWRVKRRNRQAGFGPVSRCEREAVTLKALENRGLAGPQWLAYGRGADGRAFLLVESVAPAVELRETLRDERHSMRRKYAMAQGIARGLAQWHNEGFATPDLSAKHVFVELPTNQPILVDWQSTPTPTPLPLESVIRSLALLHATTHGKLASAGLKFHFLKCYHQAARVTVPLKVFAKQIQSLARTFASRSTVRDQLDQPEGDLKLVWLAGEAVCVRPAIVPQWPTPADTSPFYPTPTDTAAGIILVGLPDGRTVTLTRHISKAPWGRLKAWLKGMPWRSPAANDSRLLFQLERAQVSAPRLLAFGQRFTSSVRCESFTLTDLSPIAEPVSQRLNRPFNSPLDRFLFLRNCGRALRAMHDAGAKMKIQPDNQDLLLTLPGMTGEEIIVNAPDAVERTKRLTDRDRFADMQNFLVTLHRFTTKTDRYRVALGYVDEARGLPKGWRRAISKLIQQ